ncbi:hypothetical protein ACFPMF_22465 [Larkinella bovis]|uniref:Uncharacterized protein n=1 Tax=Larkinella bovis TaxID=683041 RepID=A0ABW0IF95_9BACT
MERFLTLLIASLCAAPLYFFLFSGIVFSMNKGLSGDSGMAVAYFGTWGGFLAAFVGFWLTWLLAQRLLADHFLRYLQLFDGVALIGWLVTYLIWSADEPYVLQYADHRAVLDVEARVPKAFLNGQAIDSALGFQFIGQDFESRLPMPVREEGGFVILPWQTTPYEINKWRMRVFVYNEPVDYQLDLPKHPQESTAWSGWITPSAGQQSEPLPARMAQNFTLRYRFRLVPHGSPD